MEARDILGSAPTGMGKNCGVFIARTATLARLSSSQTRAPRVLVLTPTRELAMQVAQQTKDLAQFTSLKIATITGGVAYQKSR